MADLQKVIVSWTGFQGAPGYNVFYRGPTNNTTSNLRTFYDAVKALLAVNVDILVSSTGDTVDDNTGVLNGSWSSAVNAVVASTGAGLYASPAGACVKWNTDAIIAGRRLRGKTFLVPLTGAAYEADGSLSSGAFSTIQTAASALVTAEAANLGVWHRPVSGVGGAWHPVVSATLVDRVAILRSRRD